MEEQKKKTEETIADLNKKLRDEIAIGKEATKKLEEAQKAAVADVATLKTDYDGFKKAANTVKEEHAQKNA